MRIRALALAWGLAMLAAVPGAWATPGTTCAPRAAVLSILKEKHAERPIALGLDTRSGGVIEITASRAGGWTLLLSLPNGLSCALAAGTDWQDLRHDTDASAR